MAQGATAPPPGSTYTLEAITDSIDAADCTTVECAEVERLLTKGNPGRLPIDSDELPGVSADRAHHSARYDQFLSSFFLLPSSFSLTRQPGIVPAFLFPTLSSESLRGHLRERAPPPAVALATAGPCRA